MYCPVCDQKEIDGWCRRCWLVCVLGESTVVVGWVDLDKSEPEVPAKILLPECRRIYKASDWQRWSHLLQVELYEIKDPEWQFQFSMLADWLADNDCPLQEAAVRQLLEK